MKILKYRIIFAVVAFFFSISIMAQTLAITVTPSNLNLSGAPGELVQGTFEITPGGLTSATVDVTSGVGSVTPKSYPTCCPITVTYNFTIPDKATVGYTTISTITAVEFFPSPPFFTTATVTVNISVGSGNLGARYEGFTIFGTKLAARSNQTLKIIRDNIDRIQRGAANGIKIDSLAVYMDGKKFPTDIFTSLLTDGGEPLEESSGKTSVLKNFGVFVNGTINFGDKDSTALESGFHFNSYEVTGGIDYRFTDNFVLGLALDYTNSDIDIDSSGGHLDTDGYSASIYGLYFVKDKFYIDGIVGLGITDFDLGRNVFYPIASPGGGTSVVSQTMNSDTDGLQKTFSLGGGYNFNTKKSFTFSPFGNINYVRIDIDSFREHPSDPGGTGSELRLKVDSHDVESLTTAFGCKAFFVVNTRRAVLLPHARLEWMHEFKNDSRRITTNFIENASTKFATLTDSPDKDFLNFDIGLTAKFPGGKTAFIDYKTIFGLDDFSSHNITFGFRLEF